MQAEKVQTCYICKIKFVCPCWEEKVQLKERCCALGKVEYAKKNCPILMRVYHTTVNIAT